MSQQKFTDRKNGLKILENAYSNYGSSLFIIYGRKRVKKIELINRIIDKRGVYFPARKAVGSS